MGSGSAAARSRRVAAVAWLAPRWPRSCSVSHASHIRNPARRNRVKPTVSLTPRWAEERFHFLAPNFCCSDSSASVFCIASDSDRSICDDVCRGSHGSPTGMRALVPIGKYLMQSARMRAQMLLASCLRL
eukprot:3937410-Rhodomonas_salina.1